MQTFAPEFAHHWIVGPTEGDEAARAGDDDSGSHAQQEALEALADRVNAARSVV